MERNSLHLSGLNGIRAIAAIAVVISHTTLDITKFGLPFPQFGKGPDGTPTGLDLAGFGVSIFFALSGFLITYLLLMEKKKSPINVKFFYIRRILRIWPLYYLYIAVCLLSFALIHFKADVGSLPFYIFLCANIPFITGSAIPYIAHFWSLGVEEQFYSFWPWVVKKAGASLLAKVIALAAFLIALKLVFRFTGGDQSLAYRIIHVTRFQCMLIGAAGAILFFENNALFLRICTSKLAQIVAWLIIGLTMVNKFHIASVLDNEFISVVAVVLIMGQVTKRNRIINLENSALDLVGNISYGIYVIHPLVILLLSKAMSGAGSYPIGNVLRYGVVYLSVFAVTIPLAYLSYEYFEKRFLRLKDRYAIIRSSPAK